VEVVEVDVRERNKQEVGEHPQDRVSRWQLQPREQVDRPRPEGEGQGLDHEQRLRVRKREVKGNEQEEDRREMVAQQGVGDRHRLAHGRFERAALGGVPEDLVEQTKVEAERVIGLMPKH